MQIHTFYKYCTTKGLHFVAWMVLMVPSTGVLFDFVAIWACKTFAFSMWTGWRWIPFHVIVQLGSRLDVWRDGSVSVWHEICFFVGSNDLRGCQVELKLVILIRLYSKRSACFCVHDLDPWATHAQVAFSWWNDHGIGRCSAFHLNPSGHSCLVLEYQLFRFWSNLFAKGLIRGILFAKCSFSGCHGWMILIRTMSRIYSGLFRSKFIFTFLYKCVNSCQSAE